MRANQSRKGGVCVTHCVMKKRCSHEGCANGAVKGGVCITHGAMQKRCIHKGCANRAIKVGVCVTHGATRKRCSHSGCANQSRKGGVCVTHGATRKRCSHEGCASQAVKGGVCITHGAMLKRCSHEGCANQAVKGGVCRRHRAMSLAAASGKMKRPPQSTGGFEATTAGGIARRSGRIGVDYLQMNMGTASARQPPSPRPSATIQDSSDDEELCSWIYKSWTRFREGTRCLDLQELASHKET